MLSFDMNRSTKKNFDKIIVKHGNEQVEFRGTRTVRLEKPIRDSNDEEVNLFQCLTDYVQTLPETTQLELFNLYKEAHKTLNSNKPKSYEKELLDLKAPIDTLVDKLNVYKYMDFIQYSDYLVIPKGLEEAASKGDYPVETTILDVDYVNLVKLAFIIRGVFPIIFELVNKLTPVMGAETAQLYAGELIKSNTTLVNLPGYVKLDTYINYVFQRRGIPTRIDAVTSGEHFTDAVVFSALFDRLACAVIPETEKGKNLATAVNATVMQHSNKGPVFRDKTIRISHTDDKRSIFDKYQITEDVKVSDLVMQAEFFSFGLFNERDEEKIKDRFKYQAAALEIKQPELIEMVYDRLPPNWSFFLHSHIVKILQLTFQGHVSPFVFEACDYTQLMAAIAIAQVKLSEMGFNYLPSLLGVVENHDGSRQLADCLKLTSEDKEYISSICDIQSKNSEGRSYNEALLATTDLLEEVGNGIWLTNLEYGVLSDKEIYNRVKVGTLFELEIEGAIKTELIALIRHNND